MTSKTTFSLTNFDCLPEQRPASDRFIPSRSSFEDLAMGYKIASRASIEELSDSPNDENKMYSKILKSNFNKREKATPKTCLDLGDLESSKIVLPPHMAQDKTRKIPKVPFKVLDAPFLQDDFYLNVVDWSASNSLAVGLGNAVYMWGFHTNTVEKVSQFDEYNMVTGVCWDKLSDTLAIGALNGNVQIWDIQKMKCVQTYEDHFERVGALSLHNAMLLTGSRDRTIQLRDLRAKQKPISSYLTHKQEICGLKWSPDGQYFASGGNDNKLFVYSPKTLYPLMKKNHKAAVKAIAWSEKHYGLLATGAGTADRCIRVWNVLEKKIVDFKDTGSQICNIIFSKHDDEIITSHGFSNNEICIWRLKGLKKTHTLPGHTSRVLYLSMSPNGEYIVTGAGDETLRFWNLNYDNKEDCKLQTPAKSLQFAFNVLR